MACRSCAPFYPTRAITSLLVAAASLVAAYVVNDARKIADIELKKAQTTQSLFLAELARQHNAEGNAGLAILLALAALPDTGIARPYVPEAELQLDAASRTLRERVVLESHHREVLSAAFSPDGKRIVTASGDRTARLWDAETGKQIGEPLKGHDANVNSAAFSPDGKRIVTASGDGTARLWNAETGNQVGEPLKGHVPPVWNAAFSPNGKRIVTASIDRRARLWDAETRQQIGEPLQGHEGSSVFSAAFSPDGKRIVTASIDKTVRLWDAQTGKQIGDPLKGHEASVRSAAFSRDGKRIVTASGDRTARLWHAESGKQIGEPLKGHEGDVRNAAFSSDGKRIVTASGDGTARLWRIFADTQELVSDVKAAAPRCLTSAQRSAFFLPQEPPHWCIELEKWPYRTPAWKQWLSDTRAGKNPPLPLTQ